MPSPSKFANESPLTLASLPLRRRTRPDRTGRVRATARSQPEAATWRPRAQRAAGPWSSSRALPSPSAAATPDPAGGRVSAVRRLVSTAGRCRSPECASPPHRRHQTSPPTPTACSQGSAPDPAAFVRPRRTSGGCAARRRSPPHHSTSLPTPSDARSGVPRPGSARSRYPGPLRASPSPDLALAAAGHAMASSHSSMGTSAHSWDTARPR